MKKNNFVSLLLISMSALMMACSNTPSQSTTPQTPTTSVDEKRKQIILDNTFKKGFSMSSANGSQMDTGWFPENRWPMSVDLTYGEEEGNDPLWMGAQHGDIYGLNDIYNKTTGNKPTYENGYYTFKDTSKELSVNPEKGALYMELNTSKEYTRPRKAQEQWCHLLLEQGFAEPVHVSEASHIQLTADLEMKKFENHMSDTEFESGNHTTQFLMYLVIKSEAALDANDFFWFGISFYDYRYPNGIPEGGMVDAGGAGATSKFIYHMPGYDLLPNGLPLNEKQSIDIDLKTYIGSALVLANTKFGKFTNSTIDDLTFQSMNIGFEIPGTFDCGIELSNFGIYIEK